MTTLINDQLPAIKVHPTLSLLRAATMHSSMVTATGDDDDNLAAGRSSAVCSALPSTALVWYLCILASVWLLLIKAR